MVATARPGQEEAHVRAFGARETVDWSKDTDAAVRELYPDGVDGVIDLVSRDPSSFSEVAELARPGGAVVTTLGAARDGAGSGRRTANVHSAGDPASCGTSPGWPRRGTPSAKVDVPVERIDDAFALLATGPLGKVGLSLP